MRWLVTGGLGFIGSHFIRLALRERPGLEIVNLDAMTYAGNPANLRDVEGNPRYRFVRGDICDDGEVGRSDGGCRRRRELCGRNARRPLDRRSRGLSYGPMRTERWCCCKRSDDAASRATCKSRPTKSTATCPKALRLRAIRCGRAVRMLRAKRPAICSCLHITRRTVFRPSSRAEAIHTARTNIPEKIVPLFVTNLLDDRRGSASMATVCRFATGSTSKITPAPSFTCSNAARAATPTTSPGRRLERIST